MGMWFLGFLRFLKSIFIFSLAIWFIEWFIKGLFSSKWWWVFWLWLILSIIHYYTYKSSWPQ